MPAFLAWPALKLFFGNAFTSAWAGIKSFFGSLNSQGWMGLIGCVLLSWLSLHHWGEARHWKKQSAQFEKLYNADETAAQKIAQHALALKAQLDSLGRNISTTLKGLNDAKNTRIDSSADALRVRGSGKAACPGNTRLPASSSGHQQPSGTGNAALPQLRDAGGIDLIALPFADTVDFGQEHDRYRAEVLTWREWYRQQSQRLTTLPAGSVQK